MKEPTNTKSIKPKTAKAPSARSSCKGSGLAVSSIAPNGSKVERTSPVRVSVRPQSKRRQKRATNWLQIVELCVLAAALCFGLHYLLTNSRFMIRHIEIDGIQTVNISQIEQVADVPARSNIFLYLIRQRATYCRRIVDCDPAIEAATVAVDFPSSLRVHIVERQPFAILHPANGAYYLMDSEKVPYRLIKPAQDNLPVVAIPASLEPITQGKPLPTDIDDHVSVAYSLMNLLNGQAMGQLSGFRTIEVDRYDNLSLLLRDQLLIKLGQQDGIDDRIAAVESALAADPSLAAKAEYLDYTTNRPAIMQKPQSAAESQ